MSRRPLDKSIGSYPRRFGDLSDRTALLGRRVCTLPQFAFADLTPLNGAAVAPNIMEIIVRKDAVYVSLEAYVGNLAAFQELLPNEFLKSDTTGRPSLAERLRKFSEDGLKITADGNKLQAELLVAEPRERVDRSAALAAARNPLSQLPTPKPPEDNRVFYVELKYPFKTRPDSLVFVPPAKPNGTAEVSIGFIAFHESVPVIDFRYLSGPETLRLDWMDPWYSHFDNKNLKRHHTSALMTFLYVEPREVRHETLIRVRDLEDWVDLGITGIDVLNVATQARVKEAARAFLTSVNPVQIDGEPVEATAARVEFLTVTTSGLEVVENENDLDLPNAILGIILSFPVSTLPNSVSVGWEMFNERNSVIQATATDPAGPFLKQIYADAPEFNWNNYLQVYEDPEVVAVIVPVEYTIQLPLLSTLLAMVAVIAAGLAIVSRGTRRVMLLSGAGVGFVLAFLSTSSSVINVRNPFDRLPDAKTSSHILAAVLENVSIANLEITKERRNRELETVVSSDAIQEVTEELDRALAIRVVGGGLARVDSVQDVALQDIRSRETGSGFQAVASWRITASAGHWGHDHKRNVSYRALVELSEDANTWKLVAITILDAKRLN